MFAVIHVKFNWMEILSSWGQRAVSSLLYLEFTVWCGCDYSMKYSMIDSMKGSVVWWGKSWQTSLAQRNSLFYPLTCSFPSFPGNGADTHPDIQIRTLGPFLIPLSPSAFVSRSSASPVRFALKSDIYFDPPSLPPPTSPSSQDHSHHLLAMENKCFFSSTNRNHVQGAAKYRFEGTWSC